MIFLFVLLNINFFSLWKFIFYLQACDGVSLVHLDFSMQCFDIFFLSNQCFDIPIGKKSNWILFHLLDGWILVSWLAILVELSSLDIIISLWIVKMKSADVIVFCLGEATRLGTWINELLFLISYVCNGTWSWVLVVHVYLHIWNYHVFLSEHELSRIVLLCFLFLNTYLQCQISGAKRMGQAFCFYHSYGNRKIHSKIWESICTQWKLSMERDDIGVYMGFTGWSFHWCWWIPLKVCCCYGLMALPHSYKLWMGFFSLIIWFI